MHTFNLIEIETIKYKNYKIPDLRFCRIFRQSVTKVVGKTAS